MKERSRIHRSQIKGYCEGADVGAIADAEVITKKEQLYERQW